MASISTRKKKILNDPVYGFITIPSDFIFDLIEHPWFQRLRRICQLGLSSMVYSGAIHTRFQHVLGAMHLMNKSIEVLRSKGVPISDEEAEGLICAILLHDIGHGPFSHTLERSLVRGVHHEDLSDILMQQLNREFGGRLTTALDIFNDRYPRRFLHQLVSSQLDMDRMDYLRRDTFFTGVSEGHIGSERIIEMLAVADDRLVVEAKGIYSIEKFIIARRLMYWQVYLHKTVLAAEFMLMQALRRAVALARGNTELFASPALGLFLKNDFSHADFAQRPDLIAAFAALDDFDVLGAIKVWQHHPDFVLSRLCSGLVHRRLFKITLQSDPISHSLRANKTQHILGYPDFNADVLEYFLLEGSVDNRAYQTGEDKIGILYKDGTVKDLPEAADLIDFKAISGEIRKYYLAYYVES
jgi:HD superfamily phosphohydrolase